MPDGDAYDRRRDISVTAREASRGVGDRPDRTRAGIRQPSVRRRVTGSMPTPAPSTSQRSSLAFAWKGGECLAGSPEEHRGSPGLYMPLRGPPGAPPSNYDMVSHRYLLGCACLMDFGANCLTLYVYFNIGNLHCHCIMQSDCVWCIRVGR